MDDDNAPIIRFISLIKGLIKEYTISETYTLGRYSFRIKARSDFP